MTAGSLFSELFQLGLYKPSQGRITRQVTCVVLWVAFTLAAWRLYEFLYEFADVWRFSVPLALLVIGFWGSYRIVNYARFADFLIAVEAEMNKVSWPSRSELIRSALVVIFVIIVLAMILFVYDLLWEFLFKHVLGILQ